MKCFYFLILFVSTFCFNANANVYLHKPANELKEGKSFILPPPANDDCSGAILLTVTKSFATAMVVGTMLSATASTVPGGTSCNTKSTNIDVWYRVKVPTSGNVVIALYAYGGTTDAENDYSLQLFKGSCGSLNYIGCDEDGGTYETPGELMPAISFGFLIPNETIYLRVRKTAASIDNFGIAAYDAFEPVIISTQSCVTASVQITPTSGNLHRNVPVVDNTGALICGIRALGNDLGTFTASQYINSGPVRKDAKNIYYIDRNYAFTSTKNPIDVIIQLPLKVTERQALGAVDPEVTSVIDLNISRHNHGCAAAAGGQGTEATIWGFGGYANGIEEIGLRTDILGSFFLHGGYIQLPVTLKSFTAMLNKTKEVEVTWTSEAEKNVEVYIIERSADGKNFDEIGQLKASEQSQYTYTDAHPNAGTNYYRLKVQDYDQSSSLSKVASVSLGKTNGINFFPNPADEFITINFDEPRLGTIIICDMKGNQLKTFKKTEQIMNLDISELNSGTYILRYMNNQGVSTSMFNKI